jgi:hypothetical protein
MTEFADIMILMTKFSFNTCIGFVFQMAFSYITQNLAGHNCIAPQKTHKQSAVT